MSLLSAWERAQSSIKDQIGPPSYERWFSCVQAKEKNPETLVIEAPDGFFQNWIVNHYLKLIEASLKKEEPSATVNVEFAVNPHLSKKQTPEKFSALEKEFREVDSKRPNLNPRFTFDHFVIGPSNRFACAASLAVAESPAKAYNPLFIYGRVGLGKTHLLQAVTHKIQAAHPKLKYCYISSESFMNELIDAIRNRSTNQFRQKYRNIDVLLIDDIHFIAGKEATQEEFFHTFNTLHDSRKQIIISSDRPPKDIANLEERLRSRFAWGLIADIQPPDFETRVAILRKKMENEPIPVPDDVIHFIAQEIKTNIRELEGALIRVAAYSLLEEKPVSLPMAKMVLKDMIQKTGRAIGVDLIQRKVAEFFNLSVADIKVGRRNKNIVLPRQVAMYLSRTLTNLSLPEIGQAFGGKDHTTVLHSYRKIERDMERNQELKNTLEKLTTTIQQ